MQLSLIFVVLSIVYEKSMKYKSIKYKAARHCYSFNNYK